ncbi:MAG: prepilin-type N-terminal cleavage/methylation domain-containing protein [Rickettsiales bacterium]
MTLLSVAGFTLVELSIVLVIIGLIIGGVLVGRDLINAAAIRSQISQIEQIRTAVKTFKLKYGELPGDISASNASSSGFTTRSGAKGWGDGNGIIEGGGSTTWNYGLRSTNGELCLLWIDLGDSGLIEGKYYGGTAAVRASTCAQQFAIATGEILGTYYPKAKLGNGNYVYAWSGGVGTGGNPTSINGINYLGIMAITSANGGNSFIGSNYGIGVTDAYNIDKKIDDGTPENGMVQAIYTTSWSVWSPNDWQTNITSSTTKCYNSGNNVYYIPSTGTFCGLSFKME